MFYLINSVFKSKSVYKLTQASIKYLKSDILLLALRRREEREEGSVIKKVG